MGFAQARGDNLGSLCGTASGGVSGRAVRLTRSAQTIRAQHNETERVDCARAWGEMYPGDPVRVPIRTVDPSSLSMLRRAHPKSQICSARRSDDARRSVHLDSLLADHCRLAATSLDATPPSHHSFESIWTESARPARRAGLRRRARSRPRAYSQPSRPGTRCPDASTGAGETASVVRAARPARPLRATAAVGMTQPSAPRPPGGEFFRSRLFVAEDEGGDELVEEIERLILVQRMRLDVLLKGTACEVPAVRRSIQSGWGPRCARGKILGAGGQAHSATITRCVWVRISSRGRIMFKCPCGPSDRIGRAERSTGRDAC